MCNEKLKQVFTEVTVEFSNYVSSMVVTIIIIKYARASSSGVVVMSRQITYVRSCDTHPYRYQGACVWYSVAGIFFLSRATIHVLGSISSQSVKGRFQKITGKNTHDNVTFQAPRYVPGFSTPS